ncbi:hypothetical protein [Nostoc sp.]
MASIKKSKLSPGMSSGISDSSTSLYIYPKTKKATPALEGKQQWLSEACV